jgi:glycyl-tRNA synthetase beta subunit
MASFLLEVGTEELPASFIVDALRQWQERIPKNLDEHQLTTSKVSVYGTPRRLAVLIEYIAALSALLDSNIIPVASCRDCEMLHIATAW